MWQNHFKIAWRNLAKNKMYSVINIGGLAMGMTVAMLMFLWIWDEISFNTYHENYSRIAQIRVNQRENEGLKTWDNVPVPYIHELKTNYAAYFKHIVASTDINAAYALNTKEKNLNQQGVFISAEAPEMLSLKMLKGTRNAMEDRNVILLSASAAQAFFGDKNPLNQVVNVSNQYQLKVGGVYEDLPKNTQFQGLQFMASWDLFFEINPFMKDKKWDNHAVWMYVETAENTSLAQINAAIKDAELKAISKLPDMQEEVASKPQIWLQPMADWHLYSDFENGVVGNKAARMLWIMGLIGFFVLLLACINFVSLSTARSEKRSKEVGVRKAIGSTRAALVAQFFSESFLVVFSSFALAFVGVLALLPGFNVLTEKDIQIPLLNPYFWSACLLFILFVGILAGIYPALYLSSFRPISILKNTFQAGAFSNLLRQVLVVGQFTVSIALIICSIVIYKQILTAKNRPTGYESEHLVLIEKKFGYVPNDLSALRNELIQSGIVSEMSESQSPVTGVWSTNSGFNWNGQARNKTKEFATLTVSSEYAKTVGLQFVAGRNFSPDLASDTSSFVINEAAAKLFGFPDPLGKTISWKSQFMTNDVEKPFQIIGVVKDMVMESPFEPAKPTIFFLQGAPNWINLKLNPAVTTSAALHKLEAVFKKISPTMPFEYQFADDEYGKKFAETERTANLANLCAMIAIFISCLGLFGLVNFVAEQRIKEIGIRKVLGASVGGITWLLTKDFLKLVLIAILLASPVANYFMQKWLADFTYRIEMQWWMFALAGMGAVAIAILTVGFQSIKAALANPVKSLRSE